MKHFNKYLNGIGVFVLGFIVVILTSAFWSNSSPAEYSYYNGIIFSILYLASVVVVCTLFALEAIKREKK